MNTDEQQSPLPLLIPSVFPKPGQQLEKHLPYRLPTITNYEYIFRQAHHDYFKFHLICYNILSQELLENNGYLYQYCNRTHLKWYKRRERIIRELLRFDPDIICLQEMQVDHFEREFRPQMNKSGYDSIYVKRSGDKSDGCCIFFKQNRIRLITYKSVPFYKPNIRILNRDNCGLIALFQPRNSFATNNDLFYIATTHLLFSPKRGDIKLAQLQYFLAEIDELTRINGNYPIVLCGDFNAYPQSPLIQFILNGYIQYDMYRGVDISGQLSSSEFSYPLPNQLLPESFVTSDCCLTNSNNFKQHSLPILTHNKQFQSVYNLENTTDVSTHVQDESKLVDYIFYTQERLNVLSYLNFYEINQLIDVHIPNHQFPSDHFLLSVKFALKYQK